LGPGDDGAVLRPPPDTELVVATDTLAAGRHFPEDSRAADIGWKALAVNLSDLAAMGADFGWAVVALTVPERDETWLDGFAAGLGELLRESGTALVGGDLTRGPLSVTVTAIGTVPAGAALQRGGAGVGDAVCVTGTLGDAALGLSRWAGGEPPADAREAHLHRRLTRPMPRPGSALRGIASAAVDVSDGLAADLGHLLTAGGIGACIRLDRLPRSAAFAALCPPERRAVCQLAGGDDYELCVTLPPDRMAAAATALGCGLTRIGEIEAGPGLRVVNAGGNPVAVPDGYDHFR
jgi:thiamine-monophosphate kinase